METDVAPGNMPISQTPPSEGNHMNVINHTKYELEDKSVVKGNERG